MGIGLFSRSARRRNRRRTKRESLRPGLTQPAAISRIFNFEFLILNWIPGTVRSAGQLTGRVSDPPKIEVTRAR
jgi:hypothetical protein